jgi:hypothetical protein
MTLKSFAQIHDVVQGFSRQLGNTQPPAPVGLDKAAFPQTQKRLSDGSFRYPQQFCHTLFGNRGAGFEGVIDKRAEDAVIDYVRNPGGAFANWCYAHFDTGSWR